MSAAGVETKDLADMASARHAVDRALAADDVAQAVALARAALDRGFKDPLFYNLTAHGLEEQGRYVEAMAELLQAYEIAPNDILILNAIARCLMGQNRVEEALKVFDASLAIEPRYAPTHRDKGDALAVARDFAAARASLERAVALLPTDPGALASLASLELRRQEFEAARTLAERALALDPAQAGAELTLAEIDLARDAAAAEALIRSAMQKPLKTDARGHAESLLGDALDAEGRYAEAFDAYAAAGDTLRRLFADQYAKPGQPTVLEMVRWHSEHFAADDPADWVGAAHAPRASDPRRHIFFVGFPRSGTTLLEQVLASHPDVVALDERQALADATLDLFTSDAKIKRLKALSPEDAQTYRDRYWARVAEYCPDVAGKVFVDKYPLNADRLALIAKLFPEARILFALRDPRDVVLSCFRRRFEMNSAMYEFCTLAGAAALYDAVMRLAELYKAKLALPFHDVRYERVVDDLRGEVGRVCDFMGIEWNESMRAFAETARRREVRTPSAAQVVRGLYEEGVGHWRNYRDELAPVTPLLAPWVEAFGYPAE